MQVETKTFITDEESIRFVSNALEKEYEGIKVKGANTVKQILKEYLNDFNKYKTVNSIYESIKKFESLS